VKRGSEKCQNKHSVAIAGIDLCHIYIYIYIYIFVIHTQQDATHRNKIGKSTVELALYRPWGYIGL
jgi:hypothetical protein